MSASKDLLLILTRNPVLGKCKTRLAATIGDNAALAIYIFLLKHTKAITENLDCAKRVYYSEYIGKDDLWDQGRFEKHLQVGTDLGERINHAFTAGFEAGFERIIIIGSDLYDLAQKDLEMAFSKLEDHDAVIGPASDGGYYLLGLTRIVPGIFKDKAWGTETVYEATLKDLDPFKVAVLEERNDIDRYEDIQNNPVFAPFLIDLRS